MESRDELLKNSQDRKASGSKHVDNTFVLVLDWCNQYGAAIAAIGTIVLAFITFLYLQETKRHRELVYTQLVNTMSPDIMIFTSPFTYRDVMKTEVTFRNIGGPTGEFNFEMYLICCNKIDELVPNTKNAKVLLRDGRISHIAANTKNSYSIEIPTQFRKEFEQASKSKDEILIHSFVKFSYVKPGILAQDRPKTETESQSYGWNPKYKRWNAGSNRVHKIINNFVKLKK